MLILSNFQQLVVFLSLGIGSSWSSLPLPFYVYTVMPFPTFIPVESDQRVVR